LRRGVSVRIRGIYATALSALFPEQGFRLVDPSPIIRERLALRAESGPEEVSIYDRRDRQGVVVQGMRGAVAEVLSALGRAVPWAIWWPRPLPTPEGEGPFARLLEHLQARYLVEFPAPAKACLDALRARHLPTLPGHHALKAVDPRAVDEAEAQGFASPEEAQAAAHQLRHRLIYAHYRPGQQVRIRHQKAGGRGFDFTARLLALEPGHRLLLEREFRPGGRYDGLDAPILEGDRGTVELYEQAWFSRRLYRRGDGSPIGELYNINTPAEVYPDHIRYLDLEVDLVRWPDGRVALADREVLEARVQEGLLTPTLAYTALEQAERLLGLLQARP